MGKRKEVFVGIDLGSDKTVAIVAEKGIGDEIKIIGYSKRKSEGIKQGVINDIWKASETIKKVVEDAETMADVPISEAYFGITSLSFRGINSHGTINISNKDKTVTDADVSRVLEQAKNVSLSTNEEIIFIVPQEFIVDEQGGIKNPIDMKADKLEVRARIISLLSTVKRNLFTCAEDANIRIKKIVPSFIASAEVVLTEDEKELGVLLIDIGKSLISVAIYHRGSIWYDAVFPAGAEYFVRDIAIGFNINRLSEAEKIIKKHGSLVFTEDEEEFIKIESSTPSKSKQIPRQSLIDILLPRAEEIVERIKAHLDSKNATDILNAGIVITGGGANLKGIEDVVSKIFNLPARVGEIDKSRIDGASSELLHPEFASSFGLLFYAQKEGGFIYKGGTGWWKKIADFFMGKE